MYFDLLVLLNLLVDFLLLLLTAGLLNRRPGFWRLLAGAAVGTSALGVLLFPGHGALILAAVIFTPALMVLAAFPPVGGVDFLLTWGTFFLVSFTAGGIVMAVGQLLEVYRGGLAGWRGVGVLVLSCLLLYLILAFLRPFVEEKRWQHNLKAIVKISWGGKEKELTAMIDTGNRLRDPFGRRPVIVADFRGLKDVLPPEVYQSLADSALQPWDVLERLPDPALALFFTVLPFRSVGGGDDILLGFRPDDVSVISEGRCRSLGTEVVLGLYRRGFGPAAEYSALLPPDLVKAC